jgi:hypothetical protein
LEFEDVRPFSPEDKPSPEICQLLLSWKRTGIPSMWGMQLSTLFHDWCDPPQIVDVIRR